MSPFTLTVFDRNLYRRGRVANPLSVTLDHRHLAPSSLVFTVGRDHPRLPDLRADGARVVLTYDGLAEPVTGMVVEQEGGSDEDWTFTVADDLTLWTRLLGWPLPGAPLDAQTVAYDERTGPAETVTKGVLLANAARAGIPLEAGPDLGRGGVVTCSWRFHPIADRLLPALQTAGLGVSITLRPPVRQTDGRFRSPGWQLEVYAPRTYPRLLTAAGGLGAWTYRRSAPTANTLVLGSQGEAEARAFYADTDTASVAAWGRAERFVDARDTTDPAVIAQRFAETRAEGAAKTAVQLTLTETRVFRYGDDGVRRGDRVRADLDGQVVTDTVTSAELAWTRDAGLVVTPKAGELADPLFEQPLAIADLRRRQRNLETGR